MNFTFTNYLLTAIAVITLTFAGGVVLLDKTGGVHPNWKKLWRITAWIATLAILVGLGWFAWQHKSWLGEKITRVTYHQPRVEKVRPLKVTPSSRKLQQQAQEITRLSQALARAEQVELKKEYVASWACERGQSFEGITESAPMRAEIIERNDTKLSFDVYYEEYGSSEVSWVRLTRKKGERTWKGTWGQDNPRRCGQLTLIETGPESWHGRMTGRSGQRYIYTLEQKRK